MRYMAGMEKENILIMCEVTKSEKNDVNYEMIGKARSLLQSQGEVVCICFGTDTTALNLIQYGANRVLLYPEANLDYLTLSEILKDCIRDTNPALIMVSGTPMGKAVAATSATDLGIGLTADCISITKSDNKQYIFTRSALSSLVIVDIVGINHVRSMCTVRPNVFKKYIQTYEEKGVIENRELKVNPEFGRLVRLLNCTKVEEENEQNLEKANLIFGIGRGVKTEKEFNAIKKLAQYYNAALGVTRTLVEAGRFKKRYQIGQSGISVAPKVYLAFGISGASQHMVGVKNADCIIAINDKEDATIFHYSDYAIVADSQTIIRDWCCKLKIEYDV